MKNNHHNDDISEALTNYVDEQIKNVQRPPDQILLDEADAVQLLKVTKRTLATWRQQGHLKFGKIGGKIYYRLSDILEGFRKESKQNLITPKF